MPRVAIFCESEKYWGKVCQTLKSLNLGYMFNSSDSGKLWRDDVPTGDAVKIKEAFEDVEGCRVNIGGNYEV